MKINNINLYRTNNQPNLSNKQKTVLPSVKNFDIAIQKPDNIFFLHNFNFGSRKAKQTDFQKTSLHLAKLKEQIKNGVYIAYSDRKFERFNSMYKAMEYTDFCKREKGLNNPIIIKAKFVESIDSKQNLVVDKEKLMKFIDSQIIKNSFFLFDANGGYEYFLSKEELEEYVLKRQQNEQFESGIDFIVEKGARVAYLDEEGKLNIQKEKHENILNALKRTPTTKRSIILDNRIYMIKRDRTFKVFSSPREAAITLGIGEDNIKGSIRGVCNPKINAAFVCAHDVEYKDENGDLCPDLDKIDRLSKGVNDRSFYLIGKLGPYRKFENIKEAGLFLNTEPNNITRALNDCVNSVKGYKAVESSEIEKITERGVIEVNRNEILKYASEIDNDYCVISDDHDFKIFTRFKDAKKYMKEKLSQKQNAEVVPASLLKTVTQEGEIVFDSKKIEEYLKNSNNNIKFMEKL